MYAGNCWVFGLFSPNGEYFLCRLVSKTMKDNYIHCDFMSQSKNTRRIVWGEYHLWTLYCVYGYQSHLLTVEL